MLRKVKVKNFRSIQDTELVFPKFGGVFGRNATGKSNLISAIELCKELSMNEDVTTYREKVAPFISEFFFQGNTNSPSEFEFIIETPNKKQYSLEFSILYVKSPKNSFVINHERLTRIEGDSRSVIYVRNKADLYDVNNKEIAFKASPTKLVLATFPDLEASEVSQSLSSISIIDKVEMSPYGYHVISSDSFGKTLDDIAVALYIKDRNLFNQAVQVTSQIIPNFVGPEIQDINLAFKVSEDTSEKKVPKFLVRWNEPKFQNFTYLSLSGGNLSTIYLIFSIFNASEKSFFLIEEIENGLHSDRIRRLIDQIRTQATNRKIQILFTTHNTDVLDMLKLDEVIYCHRNGHGTKMQLVEQTSQYEAIRSDMDNIKKTSDIFSSGLFEA